MEKASLDLAWLYWDPNRFAFTLPWIDRPVAWYGIFFVTGFIIGYFMMIKMMERTLKHFHYPAEGDTRTLHDLALYVTDRITWFVIAGTLIGARLGHVFFYEWPRYRAHPEEIIKIWEGGLASHGGVLGILLALVFLVRYLRSQFPQLTFFVLTDLLVVPSALAIVFIRIGNFFNQEILGVRTEQPWGVIFGHPADGGAVYPRHPVQLYEAGAYLIMFIILGWIWLRKAEVLKTGFLTGLCFVLAFTSRLFLEFYKENQGMLFDESFFQTGQYLSLPFIGFGLWLMLRK